VEIERDVLKTAALCTVYMMVNPDAIALSSPAPSSHCVGRPTPNGLLVVVARTGGRWRLRVVGAPADGVSRAVKPLPPAGRRGVIPRSRPALVSEGKTARCERRPPASESGRGARIVTRASRS